MMNFTLTILYNQVLTFLGNKPWVGAVTSGTGFITGSFMDAALDILQILAFVCSITISVFTGIAYFKKNKTK